MRQVLTSVLPVENDQACDGASAAITFSVGKSPGLASFLLCACAFSCFNFLMALVVAGLSVSKFVCACRVCTEGVRGERR